MDSEESPLDVLSRAATMVSPSTYDEARTYSHKEMPSSKWRRERRQIINNKLIEGPLDFSTRGATGMKPPPSYDQSIQNKMSRPSVIQSVCGVGSTVNFSSNNASKTSHSAVFSLFPDDACDPAIDEHFRRSLGKDYSSIFSKDKTESNKADNPESDLTGLSVDDHFAKALGDTWIKLKEKENEEKLNSAIKNNNNHLGNVKELSNGQGDVNIRKKKKMLKVKEDLW
ncbi:UNVERIFIED_CONTAM: hypothetical protein PYX00_004308 [Menopon gallinae]|uniref:Transcription cofactor vestigial-like protein 4 n=1 Tax=Menopon gallinae TaxID=328185 RepID=A0AAW2I3N4_9NEOP